MVCPSFGHLAFARIACAKKEDAELGLLGHEVQSFLDLGCCLSRIGHTNFALIC